MKKLVFLGYIPLTEKYADYLSLGALASRGVALEYWDLSPAYFPGLALPGEVKLAYARKFSSLAEVRAALAPQAGEVFVMLINAFEPRLLGLMRLLAELGGQIPAVAAAALQLPETQWSNFTPAFAIACAHHETQYSRLFRS